MGDYHLVRVMGCLTLSKEGLTILIKQIVLFQLAFLAEHEPLST
jgi:hypothetical protein